MLSPTFLTTCTTMTETMAVPSPRSQFGPSTPTEPSRPLMPPLSCNRKPHTIVQATRLTTTGEKNSVRKNVVPRRRWLSSTASSRASDRLSATKPAENAPVAAITSPSFGSSSSRS